MKPSHGKPEKAGAAGAVAPGCRDLRCSTHYPEASTLWGEAHPSIQDEELARSASRLSLIVDRDFQ